MKKQNKCISATQYFFCCSNLQNQLEEGKITFWLTGHSTEIQPVTGACKLLNFQGPQPLGTAGTAV